MNQENQNTQSKPATQALSDPPGSAYRWTIQNGRSGEYCMYNSTMRKPVDAQHVRNSPKVLDWAGGDPINLFLQNNE